MRVQAVIRLSFSSERRSRIVLCALEPETRTTPTSRSKVQIKSEGNSLTLNIEAKDTSALRASINSYLRFIYLTKTIMDVVDKL